MAMELGVADGVSHGVSYGVKLGHQNGRSPEDTDERCVSFLFLVFVASERGWGMGNGGHKERGQVWALALTAMQMLGH